MCQRAGARGRRGTLFLQYELQEDLGEGAFGRAVRARRRRDDQPVVVKIMHPDTLSDSAREEVRPQAGRPRACKPARSPDAWRILVAVPCAPGTHMGSGCMAWGGCMASHPCVHPKQLAFYTSCPAPRTLTLARPPRHARSKGGGSPRPSAAAARRAPAGQARNEVAVLAALDHVNIVRYLDCFTAERGRSQIVMELCEARAAAQCLGPCGGARRRGRVER